MELTDLLVIICFLTLTLAIGMYAGRGIDSIKGYAVGNRNYGAFALFATLSASYIGGGFSFGIAEKTFQYGIIYILCLLGFSLQQFLVAIVIVPKMERFYDSLSVGDIMDKLYGKTARIITGFASALVCAGIIGAQVKATGYVFHLFLGIEPVLGILLGCSIVIAYSVIGGMRAVVATDILQFCVLIIAIPLTLFISVHSLGGFENFIAAVPQANFSIPGELGTLTALSIFLSLLLGEALVPPYVQRLFIAKNISYTRKGTLASSLMSIPFFITAGMIGLVALVLQSGMDANMSLPYVIQNVLPMGLRGLAVAGLIAVIMSSADSYLNAAAIAVIHDVVRPTRAKELTTRQELKMTRICTLVIGGLAVIFAINIESALDILLYSYNFWSPIILVPLVLGILGFSLRAQDFVICAMTGIAAVVLWNTTFADTTGFDGLVIGVLANFLAFCALYRRCKVAPAL